MAFVAAEKILGDLHYIAQGPSAVATSEQT